MDRTTRYHAAIIRNDHILLLRHQFTPEYAPWEIPGGGREEGESAIACLAREVREEAGLEIKVVRLLIDRPGHLHSFYQRFIVYLCEPVGEYHLESLDEAEKTIAARWFNLRDAAQFVEAVIQSAITVSVIKSIRQALGYTKITGASGDFMLQPVDLRCEYEYNPINLDTPSPRFSWAYQTDYRGEKQTAYQILVSDGNATLWDSGKVTSGRQFADYAGEPLISRKQALWQVRAWDRNDRPGPYSEPGSFRLGLLHLADWQAEWIGYPAYWNGRALYFRREFMLDKPVAWAWVSISGLGCYELRLNGQKVGDHILDPGFTDTGKRVLVSAYDLRPFVESGQNCFGVIVGNGWYGAPKLLLQAEFEYTDGTRLQVCTGHNTNGPGWSVRTGPILENSIYGGETYDARLEIPGWDTPAGNSPGWAGAVVTDAPGGRLVSQRIEPVRITQTLSPRQAIQIQPGVTVFDLGQNIAGWARLRVKGQPGSPVRLRFAESIYPDGRVNQENLRLAHATDEYIPRGEAEEIWEPRFTYHGFRYVQVEGADEPRIEGRVVRSDTAPRGTFECSNDLFNRIHNMVWWTEYANQHSIPTDCPQRDERMGWLNDMAARTEQMLYNFDVSRFLPKWLDDIHDAQSPDGAVTDTAPYRWGNRPADPVSACYLLIPWQIYLHYGDIRPMEKHYDGLKAWVDYLTQCAENNHLLKYSYYGDWAPPVGQGAVGTIGDSAVSRDTPGALMSTGFYYYSTRLLTLIANTIGKTLEAKLYASLSQAIAEAYHLAFWDAATGGYGSNNQACNSLSLYMGLVPPDHRQSVLANLVTDVEAHEGHLTTGNLCTKYLLEVLSDNERADVAYRIAAQETYPSWGYMLANGATTCWERWEKMTGGGMNSHNHPMLSSVGSWFYKYLAGITVDPAGPGFSTFKVQPCVVGDLTFVTASLKTSQGLIEVGWERQADRLLLTVNVPVGSQANARLPKIFTPTAVQEGDTILWKNGEATHALPVVTFTHETSQYIEFTLDSGKYHLKMTS